MALTTEISNSDTAQMIASANNSRNSIEQRMATVRTLFAQHLIERDEFSLTLPAEGSAYEPQRQLTELIRGYMTADESRDFSGKRDDKIPQMTQIHTGVVGTVDFFDASKGFGFVDFPDIGERCYVGTDVIADSGFETINDGDDILCDIRSSANGPRISMIYDIQNKPHEVTLVECTVVRLVEIKHFGFASVFGRSEDAIFHFSLLPEKEIKRVALGMRFDAEVRVNSKNGLQQVRRIERILE